MYFATYGFGFILFVSIILLLLGLMWDKKSWFNFIIKSILVLSAIAGFIILFGK